MENLNYRYERSMKTDHQLTRNILLYLQYWQIAFARKNNSINWFGDGCFTHDGGCLHFWNSKCLGYCLMRFWVETKPLKSWLIMSSSWWCTPPRPLSPKAFT